ncbi:MAG: CvpA family protein [Anaerovoracaceae bacterium]|jgi:uncharacterized membrane protein required for colicin V production
MILDLMIIAILIISAIVGFKTGFVYTLIHTAGWLVALLAAFFCTPYLKPVIRAHTGFYNWLLEGFNFRFDSLTGIEATQHNMPDALSSVIGDISGGVTNSIARSFTNLVFTVAVFMLIFIVVKIILWIILRALSKEYNGRVSGVDGFFGLLFGLVRGMVLVYIFLALMLPAINLMAPDFTEGVTASLNNSYIAKTLYDNNLLLLFMQGLFS